MHVQGVAWQLWLMQSPSPPATSTVWTSLGLLLIVASFSGYVCMQPIVFFSSTLEAAYLQLCYGDNVGHNDTCSLVIYGVLDMKMLACSMVL
jgi:hypothetical protein